MSVPVQPAMPAIAHLRKKSKLECEEGLSVQRDPQFMACMQALRSTLTCECTDCRPWRSLGLHLHPAKPLCICHQVQ